jgi:hypothetical protein
VLTGWALRPFGSNDHVGFLPQNGQMAQANRLPYTIIAGDFLFTHAAFRCLAATFNRNNEFVIPCLLGGQHINLWNIQGKTDFGRGRYGHRFYSVCENDFHFTSPPYLGVPPEFLKNQKGLSRPIEAGWKN